MTINQTKNGSALTLALEGRLETTTAPELDALIKSELDGVTELTFDFSDLEYISSAGLRVLLTAHTTMAEKGGMKLLHVNEIIMDTLKVTGLANALNVVKD